MCLFKSHIFPKIALRDRVVYKELKHVPNTLESFQIRSSTMNFIYNIGVKYSKSGLWWAFINIFKSHIDGGFHSYSTTRRMSPLYVTENWYTADNHRFYRCIIPKGSFYFQEHDGKTLVSSSIIISELITVKDFSTIQPE